jgi:hypothetical protein
VETYQRSCLASEFAARPRHRTELELRQQVFQISLCLVPSGQNVRKYHCCPTIKLDKSIPFDDFVIGRNIAESSPLKVGVGKRIVEQGSDAQRSVETVILYLAQVLLSGSVCL